MKSKLVAACILVVSLTSPVSAATHDLWSSKYNEKVFGGDQEAIVAEQGLHPRRERAWLQIKEGS